MKHTLHGFFLLFLFSSFQFPSPDLQRYSTSCDRVNTTFDSNEEINYTIYYNWNMAWVRVGHVNFESRETLYAGQPSYLLKATGTTLSSYDPIYKVRDYYQTYVLKDNLRPLKYIRDTNEGGYTQFEELRFDYKTGQIFSKKGKTKQDSESKNYPLSSCTFDIVSIMYQIRNLDLSIYKVGDTIPVQIFFDGEQYNLHVKFLGKETIKVRKQGRFSCYKLSPLLIKGNIFTETEKMNVFVTADENQLPVLIESPIKIGNIKAVMQSVNNLKYPLDSKL